jgi:hypothetical protein
VTEVYDKETSDSVSNALDTKYKGDGKIHEFCKK